MANGKNVVFVLAHVEGHLVWGQGRVLQTTCEPEEHSQRSTMSPDRRDGTGALRSRVISTAAGLTV